MRIGAIIGLASALSGLLTAAEPLKLPYIYTKWKQFTVADGLPNDHIFAVKADGPRVWIGTEDGLAMLDKRTGKIKSWGEKEGLPWKVITAIDVDKKTGDVWLGLFGGGLARFSGGRFDHWHQLNSGLVNDVVYGVAVQDEYIWAATTAGASRFNTVTGEWAIFTEKNSPMEEIWNYNVAVGNGKVYLAVWGSGMLEYGYYNQDSGLASDFINNAKGRSADEAWFATDKGASAVTDFKTNTWVTYTRDTKGQGGKAVVMRDRDVLETVELPVAIPHNFIINYDIDGSDVWVATAKGLGWGIGEGYYPGLKQRPKTLAKTMTKGAVR
jgi:ligand-binding sensor domain-containing protein